MVNGGNGDGDVNAKGNMGIACACAAALFSVLLIATALLTSKTQDQRCVTLLKRNSQAVVLFAVAEGEVTPMYLSDTDVLK
jgi:hypothetical protein